MNMHIAPSAASANSGIIANLLALVRPSRPAPVATIDWAAHERGLSSIVVTINSFDGGIAAGTKALARWQARNPWPVEPLYDSQAERIDDLPRMYKAQGDHAIRYQNALRQCGRGKYQKQRNTALDDYDAECERLALLPTPTPHDIKQKARLARLEPAGGPIHRSLFRALLNDCA
jgi:hypothetical protein